VKRGAARFPGLKARPRKAQGFSPVKSASN